MDPSEQMLAVLRGDIGRLVMENAALKAQVQTLGAELQQLRPKEEPALSEAQRQALLQQTVPEQQAFNGGHPRMPQPE